SLLKQQLDDHHIEIIQTVNEPLPKVQVVANQIQQVFINILLNAMDAMPEGGKITITLQSGQDFLEILFQDNGPGVPPELRQAIFEPFTSTKEKGTGLGLSVSYGIISAHGGVLELVENHQPGACFRVALPYGEVS
ncbi:MAG: ATP-binding protein, partial [Anaerolineales bacterium]